MQNLTSNYDYETMGVEQIKPSLSPESKYLNSYCYAPTYEPMERREGTFCPNISTLDKNSHGKNNLMSSSSKYPYKYTIDFNEDKRDLDDRFSKHSDSGYDTLRTPAKMLPADPEVSDLLKFRFDRAHNDRPHSTLTYSVQSTDNQKNNVPPENLDNDNDMEWDFRNEGPADIYEFLKAEATYGNLVQNRIKEFEISPEKGETKENFELQEPLKLSSSYHSNEAHVSFIKSNESSPEKANAKKKMDSNGFLQREEEARYAVKRDIKNQNPKSVKDLLADFEKKSQMLKEQSEAEAKIMEESSNRYVFSDTETLLYDTSSDHEIADERILNHVKKNNEAPLSEDDEEVAAALGKQESFFSACRDLGRKSDKLKRKNSKSSIGGESSTNTDMTIGYNRLSIAESMVTHDDIESHRSFPREKEVLNRVEDDSTSMEEHYMPMTPSKKNVLSPSTEMFGVHSRSNSATHSAIMEDLLTTFEESSYVEMTENGLSKSLLAPKNSNSFVSKNNLKRNHSTNSSNYCEIENKGDSHYDVLYKSGSSQHYEPLYMEVNSTSSKKTNEEPPKEKPELPAMNSHNNSVNHSRQTSKTSDHFDMGELPPTPPRIILPDILNSSSTSIQKQTSLKSDSSDADDEASKDLDSIDTPRHPRFSLSDTFRPASYYLGASVERTVMEQHDSSDSDLVSPPPIPKSPPPIEDLDTSLDSTNLDSSRLDMSQDSTKRFQKDNNHLWNISSHSSELKTVHEKMEMLMSQPDDTLSSETDSINSMRKSRHEILMKRRPVSADILNSLRNPDFLSSSPSGRKSVGSDLDSIGSRNGLAVTDSESIDFDQYLEELQVNHNLDFSNLSSKNFDYDKKLNNGYPEEDHEKLRYNMDSQQSLYSQDSGQSAAQETNKECSTRKGRLPRDMEEVHYENLNAMYNSPPPPLPPTGNSLVPPPRPPSYSHTLERRREQQSSRQSHSRSSEPGTSADSETYERLRRDQFPGDKRPGFNTLPVHHRRQDSTVGVVINQKVNEPVQNYQMNHATPSTSYGENATNSTQDQRGTQREFTENNVNSQRGEHNDDSLLGAPYYYSDLLKEQEDSLVSDNSASSYPNNSKNYTNPIPRSARNNKLNNQRDNKADLIAASKRNDIGRKVNRFANDMRDMDEATRFAVELKATSEQFLGTEISSAASKCLDVDEKNLFESDTIQRRKSGLMTNNLNKKQYRSQTPDPLSTRNLYPLGISDKNESYGGNEISTNRRRSRSLEGLLDDPELYADPSDRPARVSPGSAISRLLQTTQPLQPRASTLHNVALNSNLPPSSRAPPPPPDVWEEDNVWRESLRHSRSLDDLDQRDTAIKSGRQSADILSHQKKISREVTYVNDIVTSRMSRQDNKVQENDDRELYVRLAQHDKPMYPATQQVKDNTPSKQQIKQGSFLEQGMYPTRPPSFEIDREKLRQWDLMSSAPAGMLGAKAPNNVPGRSHADNPPAQGQHTPPSSPGKLT